MSTLIQEAVAELFATQRAIAGVAIKYRVGAQDCELTAIPGQSINEQYGSDGIAATSHLHDWIVDQTELEIDSAQVWPAKGHLILTDDSRCFEVVFRDGENCWRYTDQTRQAIRIHTVEVAMPEDSDG